MILRGNAAYDESKSETVLKELRDHVAKEIGPIAKPRQIMVVQELPEDPFRQDHAAAVARRRGEPRGR